MAEIVRRLRTKGRANRENKLRPTPPCHLSTLLAFYCPPERESHRLTHGSGGRIIGPYFFSLLYFLQPVHVHVLPRSFMVKESFSPYFLDLPPAINKTCRIVTT